MGGDAVIATDDPAQHLLLAARCERALEVRRQLMDEQAEAIARQIAGLFSDS